MTSQAWCALALALACAPFSSCASRQRDDAAPAPAPATDNAATTTHHGPTELAPTASTMVELAPGVRLDASNRIVEFDARVSPMIIGGAHGRDRFLLEQFVCLAGTKDHESLVVTDVKPSVIHAALLAAGAVPGAPVTWVDEADTVRIVPPSGSPVRIEFVLTTGAVIDPRAWVVDAESGASLADGTTTSRGVGGWVFAGSTLQPSRGTMFYEADAAGTIIGLAGFGSETIAWTTPISDQEEEGELRWVAAEGAMPAGDTPVWVRMTVER